MNDQFVHDIANILEQARQRAKSAVNLSMVYAYYEIGKRIVLEEQQGAQRAAYGQQVLGELSHYLTEHFGKGYSVDNLKLMRRFYTIYSVDQIGETVFPQSTNLPAVDTGRKFYLSCRNTPKLSCPARRRCKSCLLNRQRITVSHLFPIKMIEPMSFS